jgi:hypothetical protein
MQAINRATAFGAATCLAAAQRACGPQRGRTRTAARTVWYKINSRTGTHGEGRWELFQGGG